MIRWIIEYLGTAPAGDREITNDMEVLDVRDLVDKFGNTPGITKEKIEQGLEWLRQGKRVVVCCDYGISRSNAIAAGILSCFQQIPLERAIKDVIRATGEQEIKLEPLQAVRTALEDGKEGAVDNSLRVLLTGGSGFIGQALFRELSNQCEVYAPTRNDVDLSAGALELDLLVKEHRINCIVHLANPRVYTSNRAMGDMLTHLKNVLDVCRENNVRLIYPSHWDVFSAYRAINIVADLGLPLFPKGPLGEAKMLCENLIEHHRKLHGLKCTILRSSLIYGESSDRPKFIYDFINKALAGKAIRTHNYLNGAPKLDLLYVDDFINAMWSVLQNPLIGDVNVGSGLSMSTYDIAKFIVNETHSKSTVGKLNLGEYTPNISVDPSYLEKVLYWKPRVSIERGLKILIEKTKK